LETKRRITRVLPFVLIAGIIAVGGEVASHLAPWIPTVTALLFVFASWYAHQRDQLRKTTVVFYQFDPETERVYKDLHVAFEGLVQCSATWHVTAKADVLDRKYHAGASGVVTRARINVRFGEPPLLKTNIDVPMLPAGKQTLAFMPDRVLVFEQEGVGAVSYDALKLEAGVQQFVEDGSVPADSQTVGRTWRYVNKKGGPDRRFSYNPELPIAQYGLLEIQSPSGLNELFQSSQPSAAKRLSDALVRMVSPATQASASS